MTINKKFTVVTVVLNDPKGLEKTGQSVLNQSFPCEWIVVDGDSMQPTLDIINNFCKKNVRFISEKDNGIYDGMNKGFLMSSGEYICFLNAGDTFINEKVLEDLNIHLGSNEGRSIDVLSCGAQLLIARNLQIYRPPKNAESYIWHGLPSNHQATFYKKGALASYPYDLKYRMCGDYYLASVLYKEKKIFAKLDLPVVNFSVDGVSSRWNRLLFLEPYLIQRDILGVSFARRILSLGKRLSSNLIIRFIRLPVLEFLMSAFLLKLRGGKVC